MGGDRHCRGPREGKPEPIHDISALISIPVGFLGALTGLGGASIIATSSGSASFYVREKIANVRVAMFQEMFTTVGAIPGATTPRSSLPFSSISCGKRIINSSSSPFLSS